jgi:hypothetical protein
LNNVVCNKIILSAKPFVFICTLKGYFNFVFFVTTSFYFLNSSRLLKLLLLVYQVDAKHYNYSPATTVESNSKIPQKTATIGIKYVTEDANIGDAKCTILL